MWGNEPNLFPGRKSLELAKRIEQTRSPFPGRKSLELAKWIEQTRSPGESYPDPEEIIVEDQGKHCEDDWETDDSDMETLAKHWLRTPPKLGYYRQFHDTNSGLKDGKMDGQAWSQRYQKFLRQTKKEEPYRVRGDPDVLLEEFVKAKGIAIETILSNQQKRLKKKRSALRIWRKKFVPTALPKKRLEQVTAIRVQDVLNNNDQFGLQGWNSNRGSEAVSASVSTFSRFTPGPMFFDPLPVPQKENERAGILKRALQRESISVADGSKGQKSKGTIAILCSKFSSLFLFRGMKVSPAGPEGDIP